MGSRLAAAAAIVLLLAGCGGDDERASGESPLPDDYQTTQPLAGQQLTVSKADADRPLSASERAWLRRLRGAMVEVSGSAARVEYIHLNRDVAKRIMSGDERFARPFYGAVGVLAGCSTRLRKAGRPPTERTQVGARAFQKACRTLERTARETRTFLRQKDPAGLHAGDVDLQLARGDLDAAVQVLLPRSEGRKLHTVRGASRESRVNARYSNVAAKLVGWGVEVRCWSKSDWEKAKVDAQQLTGERIGDRVAGYVLAGYRTNLGPEVCASLDAYTYERARPSGGAAFAGVVDALVVFAHEAQHAAGVVDERAAECYGMQQARDAAVWLGGTKAYAARVATAAWTSRYPTLPAMYRSGDCRDGGALDLFPESSVWP